MAAQPAPTPLFAQAMRTQELEDAIRSRSRHRQLRKIEDDLNRFEPFRGVPIRLHEYRRHASTSVSAYVIPACLGTEK